MCNLYYRISAGLHGWSDTHTATPDYQLYQSILSNYIDSKVSQCHSVTVSQSHVTVSQCHSVTVSQSHSVTVSLSHSVTVSQSHSVTVSLSDWVTLSRTECVWLLTVVCMDGWTAGRCSLAQAASSRPLHHGSNKYNWLYTGKTYHYCSRQYHKSSRKIWIFWFHFISSWIVSISGRDLPSSNWWTEDLTNTDCILQADSGITLSKSYPSPSLY